jgi:hypothetical protein
VRFVVATLVVAGCSYEQGVLGVQPDGGDDPVPDGGGTTSRPCKYDGTSLCIDFDDGKLGPWVHDGSIFGLSLPASDLQAVVGHSSPGAGFIWSSDLRVPETPNLDIPTHIAIEMWVWPGYYQSSPLLVNDQQYSVSIEGSGKITCHVGGLTATSAALATPQRWTHIACTYSGEFLQVFVDGVKSTCTQGSSALGIGGNSGTLIAPNFIGGIDDVHIYARSLLEAEVCSHADRTACATATSCPDE